MAPSLLGPFFMSQISFFRLVSVKVSNKGLEKKFNIAIAVLFTTIIGLAIACVSQRLIGDQNGKQYSIGPIHQVKFGFSEMATKFEKIFVELLTSASCFVFSAHVLKFTATANSFYFSVTEICPLLLEVSKVLANAEMS